MSHNDSYASDVLVTRNIWQALVIAIGNIVCNFQNFNRYQQTFMTASKTNLKNRTLKPVVLKNITLKSNRFFDGSEDSLDSVSKFFSTLFFEQGLTSNFELIPLKTSYNSGCQIFM